MSTKYDNLIEEINKKEEIAEQKDNLAEQLSQVTQKVNDVEKVVAILVTAVADLKEVTTAVTAASISTDNAVNAITKAILDSRKVVVTNKLDDESIGQLQSKYTEYLQNEAKLFKTHSNNINTMLDQNKDMCYEIINRGDGVYFGRKTFMRLYVVFCIFFGIILLEIVYGLLKLLGGLD